MEAEARRREGACPGSAGVLGETASEQKGREVRECVWGRGGGGEADGQGGPLWETRQTAASSSSVGGGGCSGL